VSSLTDEWERALRDVLPGLVETARSARLEELEIADERHTIRLRLADPTPTSASAPEPEESEAADAPVARTGHVGIFHRRPEDAADPIAEPGDALDEGAPVGFVDVLGVFHDVPAPFDGTIEAFLVPDGQPVEYGQAIARLTPSE
jgi:biotin carboxyl carrier protein